MGVRGGVCVEGRGEKAVLLKCSHRPEGSSGRERQITCVQRWYENLGKFYRVLYPSGRQIEATFPFLSSRGNGICWRGKWRI